MDALLLHVGHAAGGAEVVLTIIGVVLTLLSLGVAVISLWPQHRSGAGTARPGRAARRRELSLVDAEPPVAESGMSGAPLP
jgi:uncharacterized membrane protein YccF (DUF307 family)